MTRDLIVRGGLVVDGTGRPGSVADVAVTDGRVVAVGKDLGSATRTIDATGLVVAPGFIDVHTHLDVQGFWDPTLGPSPLHGVTTVLGGNCGFSVAPLDEGSADFLQRMLARVEGMPLETLVSAVPWNWRSMDDFLTVLEGRLSVNAGFMAGHSAIRRVVMGSAASERPATPEELAAMRALLGRSLGEGALGFSTSWGTSHHDGDGAPVPSRHATAQELTELAAICRDFPGTSLGFSPGSGLGPFGAADVEVMIGMSLAAGRPLNWNLLNVTVGDEAVVRQRLDVSMQAAARGAKVVGLVLARNPGSRYSFANGLGPDGLPEWGPVLSRPIPEKLEILRDPAERARLRAAAEQPNDMSHHAQWATKVIVEVFHEDGKRFEGRTVGDIAAELGVDPYDALLDIACADGLRTSFVNQPRVDSDEDWALRAAALSHPGALVGASDAGAHLDMVATFDHPSVVLSEMVRERGLFSLERAVQLLSSEPADLYGLVDRGRIAPGAAADLVIFDPDQVGTSPASMRFDLPEGAGRLFAAGSGYAHVFVNGTEIVTDGSFTGSTPGTVLRSGRDTVTPSMSLPSGTASFRAPSLENA